MASALTQGRRRQNSSAASSLRSGHTRRKSRAVIQPKSQHTTDEFLQDFLDPSFDPAQFLNSALPPLQQRSVPGRAGSDVAPLAELSSQAQTLLSQLNAQTTRLSNTLTQLTDDILRSGSRLAYEVELLRGETLGLTETLNETLQDDINKFVPGGLQEAVAARNNTITPGGDDQKTPTAATTATAATDEATTQDTEDPAFIKQLQTLTLVRSRLDAVIKTFGDAMEFVFPPSELSVSSSFLSVSAPDPGSQQQSSEDKGQEVLKNLRQEISGFLTNAEDPVQGIEKAAQRIEELKELTAIWKDTAEEKGRNKFIESLAKMVEDRHRDLMKEMEQGAKREGRTDETRSRKGSVTRDAAILEDSKASIGGFGLISQLQRLRTGL